ncbi:MAG: protease inhibitor I42 family protein [Candidatus Methanoperedens sp.]|nr:protease inhibitor I42 family protein [Candidatus Methanoperedens sp.]MCZ7369383.1 protease inhibitor I42 family protein [Candidatus Methanoperedens sp.]
MEVPAKIELKAGEKYTFRLKGLGAAGYNWEYSIEETKKVVSVSLEFVDDQKKAKRILPPGYSKDVMVTVEARESGQATIRFVQRRSWEKVLSREHIIEISVN